MTVQILIGDVFDKLRKLPDESVHCVVTSPPYWGLRDYGVSGQLGLEPTLGEHLETMVKVFEEVRRVMRPDATLWLNYGDCYAASPNGRSAADTKAAGGDDRAFRDKPFSTVGPIQARSNGGEGQHFDRRQGVLKPKDLCMIPNRLAIALQEAGWWVRSEIIWAKPNPMPESVTDRPTNSHEKIWLLSRSQKYYYDAEAVREADKGTDHPRNILHKPEPSGGVMSPHQGIRKADGRNGNGRNLRNVWNIATAPYAEAHFATFPPALAERCIKAGTSERGVCAECGAPWVREVEAASGGTIGESWHDHSSDDTAGNFKTGSSNGYKRGQTISWGLSCACNVNTVPATVLDPFGGSGTTGLVADRLGRNAILIELNPEYAELARKRIDQDAATRGDGPDEIMRGDDLPLFA